MKDRNILAELEQKIASTPVILFMKGTPKAPMCGFSSVVCQILTRLGVSFEGVNVMDDPEIRQGIKDFTNWPTIPQLYIDGEFMGGADIVRELYQSGELKELLSAKGYCKMPAVAEI